MRKIERLVIDLTKEDNDQLREFKKALFERSCLEPLVRTIIADTAIPMERVTSAMSELATRATNAEIIRQELVRKYRPDKFLDIMHFDIDTNNDKLIICGEVEVGDYDGN